MMKNMKLSNIWQKMKRSYANWGLIMFLIKTEKKIFKLRLDFWSKQYIIAIILFHYIMHDKATNEPRKLKNQWVLPTITSCKFDKIFP